MPVTQWNDAEDQALQGLPLVAQLLYLRGLRRWMDYRSGEVGRSRRISWQMLREVLYVEPHKGLQESGSPHESKVRRLVVWLVKAGLVVERGTGEWLVFFLPLASRDSSAPDKADIKPTGSRQGQADTSNASSGAACDDKADIKPTGLSTGIPDTPPESGIRISHTEAHSSVSDFARARELKNSRKAMFVLLQEAAVLVASEDDPLVVEWAESGLTLEQLTECLVLARRKKLNQPIPLNFLKCFVDEQMSRAEVHAWAVLPRCDEELESWACKHGYSRPSTRLRNYAEYRALLRSEVEQRLAGKAEG